MEHTLMYLAIVNNYNNKDIIQFTQAESWRQVERSVNNKMAAVKDESS